MGPTTIIMQALLIICFFVFSSGASRPSNKNNSLNGLPYVDNDIGRLLFEGEEDDDAGTVALDWEAHHRQIVIQWEPHENQTDWVEVLKQRGHSHSTRCKLPPEHDSVPNTSPLVVTAHELVPSGKRRVAWFFVLGFNPTPAYEEMVKSVVLSARIRATVLEPYFLYIMNEKQHKDFHDKGGVMKDSLGAWMVSLGVRVVPHVISFAHAKRFEKEKAQGAQWARLDLFSMAAKMKQEFKKRKLITSHVLYTDMDLFFSHDPPLPGDPNLKSCGVPYFEKGPDYKKRRGQGWSSCTHQGEHGKSVTDPNWPYIFGAGTEVFVPWGMNSGVMYINIDNATIYADDLIAFAVSRQFRFSTADQQCLELFFMEDNFRGGKTPWDWLDDAVINGRGFIPPGEFLIESGVKKHQKEKEVLVKGHNLESRSSIWHWHGYKSDQIRCLFDRIKDGSWDVSKNTDKGPEQADVPGCQVVTGNGKFNMGLGGCYLVTYAWMLNQHERLQNIARTMKLLQEGEW